MPPMRENSNKIRAPRNKTLTLSSKDIAKYRQKLIKASHGPIAVQEIENKILNQDLLEVLDFLPDKFVDLMFVDPPYNLTKSFGVVIFRERTVNEYLVWLETWFQKLMRILKPTASVYVCGDWRSSAAIHFIMEKHLIMRNRITWEREKGRGAKANWKNCSEDIWFGTLSNEYTFNVEAVKLKRRVIAPYTDSEGKPKDWHSTEDGNYRLTHPSNIWNDITIPFWSMLENTDHPTQKPEKLLAKIILASSKPDDMVFDPFLGSGTTAVVAKKLGRRYSAIEAHEAYCCLAEKRLAMADSNKSIQGYRGGIFHERNSLQDRGPLKNRTTSLGVGSLFTFPIEDSDRK